MRQTNPSAERKLRLLRWTKRGVADKIPPMLPEARATEPVTEAEAARLAREIYGLEASARTLPSEYDDNFHLIAADGRAFVLKVMCVAREREFVDMQCLALEHIARRASQLTLPRVCPARTGEAFAKAVLADGTERFVWMLNYLPGTVLAEVRSHTTEIFESLGRLLGEMDSALQDFSHPHTRRELKWDLSRAGWIREQLHHIGDPARRALVEKFLRLYETEVVPAMPSLRRSVIYGDANDYNVIVGDPSRQPREVSGVIDFGDMHHGLTVSEPAVAAAYAILGKKNPLEAATAVVRGYHHAFPLQEAEITALYPLIGTRLAVSVVNSARRKTLKPDDPYVTVSEAPAWEALEKLAEIHPRFAHYSFRAACGLTAVPRSQEVQSWLKDNAKTAASILDLDVRTSPCRVFDLSVGSAFLGANPQAAETATLTEKIFDEMKCAGVRVGVGQYNEARLLYTSPLFGASTNPADERRTIHLGIDLFVEPRTSIHAPLEGVVHILANNTAALDYGPLVILRHSTNEGLEFFTLYGHLAKETLAHLKIGDRIAPGQIFAWVGKPDEN